MTKLAIVVHVYYLDIYNQYILPLLEALPDYLYTLYITTPLPKSSICTPSLAHFLELENRGRDVLPFLLAMRNFKIADNHNVVLKLHTKIDQPNWWCAQRDFPLLINEEKIRQILNQEDFTQYGLTWMEAPFNAYLNDNTLNTILKYLKTVDFSNEFIAGTMFFSRTDLMTPHLRFIDECWDEDNKSRDGTLAHAVERILTYFKPGSAK